LLLLRAHNTAVSDDNSTDGEGVITCENSEISSTSSNVDQTEATTETTEARHVTMTAQDAQPQVSKYTYKDNASTFPARSEDIANDKVEIINRFPYKLHQMLSHPDFRDVVTWLPHGRGFKVLNRKQMENNVLSCFFESANYNSFVRLLNAWQFRRKRTPSTGDKTSRNDDFGSYYHELFLRTKPHLLQDMERLPRYNGKKLPMDDNSEPDFSQYPRLPKEDSNALMPQIKNPLQAKSKKRKSSDSVKIQSSKVSKNSRSSRIPLSGSDIPLSSFFGIDIEDEEVVEVSQEDNEQDEDEDDEVVLVEVFKSTSSKPSSPKRASSANISAPPQSRFHGMPMQWLPSQPTADLIMYHARVQHAAAVIKAAQEAHTTRLWQHFMPPQHHHLMPPRPQPQAPVNQPVFVVVPVGHPSETRKALAAAAYKYQHQLDAGVGMNHLYGTPPALTTRYPRLSPRESIV
jgi:hypothetical protein